MNEMKNAFGSLVSSTIINVFSFLLRACDAKLFEQRVRLACTKVPAIEGNIAYHIGSGALPGDKIAADVFRVVFVGVVCVWAKPNCSDMLNTKCPITHNMVDLGKSGYADDLIAKHVFLKPPHPKQLCQHLNIVDQDLDKLINLLDVYQHHGKKEAVVSSWGSGGP